MQSQLELIDALLIAEALLGVPAEELRRVVPIARTQAALAAPFATVAGDELLYPDAIERAVICCSRISRERPFPSGNRKIGFTCMREMLAREGFRWTRDDATENATMVERLARHEVSHEEFVRWVRARTELDAG
jgi:prophage maintenance system killer protein